MDIKEKRIRVFQRAEEVFHEGAHFILGARAEILQADHRFASGRAVWLWDADTSFSAPVICAAGSQDASHDSQICLGRFRHPRVRAAGGTKIREGDPRLKAYLLRADFEQALLQPQQEWVPFSKSNGIKLTARHFVDDSKNVIVLGESCVGKRHVDCISLINYCLSAIRKSQYSIEQLIDGMAGSVVMNRVMGRTGPAAKTADIVINHVGICGVAEDSGKITVIEATGAARAVIRTSFVNTRRLDNDKWKWRVRPTL